MGLLWQDFTHAALPVAWCSNLHSTNVRPPCVQHSTGIGIVARSTEHSLIHLSVEAVSRSAALLGAALCGIGIVAGAQKRTRKPHSKKKQQRNSIIRCAGDFDTVAWRRGFCDVKDLKEGYYFLDEVENLPADLRGTYFRSGFGNFGFAEGQVRHQLDADGMMLAITFSDDGKVCVRHRIIQTQGYMRDRSSRRFVANGYFGTKAQGGLPFDLKKFGNKNPANQAAFWWQEKLLALWSYDKPHLVDPGNLGTILGNIDSGTSDLGGALEESVPFGSKPKICGTTGTFVNFAQSPSGFNTTIRILEFNKEWKPRYMIPRKFSVSGYTHFADCAVTQDWFILARPPVKVVDPLGAGFGAPMSQVLGFDPSGVGAFIFATRSKDKAKEVEIPVDALVVTDFVNAWQLGDECVVLDVLAAERWDYGEASSENEPPLWEKQDPSASPRVELIRYEVNLTTQDWKKKKLCDRHMMYPSINPSIFNEEHQYVFCAAAHSESAVGPAAGIAKVDVNSGDIDVWTPAPTEFGGQPVFIPRTDGSGQDDGYLITIMFDGAAQRSDVVILDAKDVSKGPICRIPLLQPVAYGTRGCWADGLTFTQEEIKRKYVLLRMFERKAQSWNAMESGFNIFAPNMFFERQGGKMR